MSHLTTAESTQSSLKNNEKAHIVTKNRIKTYRKEAKNATAVTLASNWLRAVGVNVSASTTVNSDLLVKHRNGDDIEIRIGVTVEDARPAVDHVFVLAKELTNRNKAIALRAFHSMTEAAGHGNPKPTSRGGELAKKASFEESFELVAMRHAEFRKVANPTAADYAAYDRVIMKACQRFLYINTKICRRHGLDIGDLKTYAQIWTANYLGLYKVSEPTNNDNERKLYAHLCQRFGNFVETLLKKERSCIPDSETASIAQYGVPTRAGGRTSGVAFRNHQPEIASLDADPQEYLEAQLEAEVVDDLGPETFADVSLDAHTPLLESEDATADEEAQQQKLSDAKRRSMAQESLKAEFAKLDHETLVFLLDEAVGNGALCYDARAEAKKQLRIHRQGCSSCSAKIQEQAAASDTGRGGELLQNQGQGHLP